MALVEKTVFVMHSAEQMFQLVDDVEAYSSFLPWCSHATLIHRDDVTTIATLHIDYYGVKQQFTTENKKEFPRLMHLQLKDGPFKSLHGQWKFTALNPQACKVEFNLQYEFANSLLEKLISPVFSYITGTFVDSFIARADKIHVMNKGTS